MLLRILSRIGAIDVQTRRESQSRSQSWIAVRCACMATSLVLSSAHGREAFEKTFVQIAAERSWMRWNASLLGTMALYLGVCDARWHACTHSVRSIQAA